MVESISHLTFIVRDIEKSCQLFKYVFNARQVYDSKAKNFSISREKFLLINDIWVALMEGDSLKEKTYNHIAFKVSEEDFPYYCDKVKELSLDIRSSRPRIAGEAKSLYFYDYDNHLFEIHTGTLTERLHAYHSEQKIKH